MYMANTTREEWLNEQILVDQYGREPGLADLPLTLMTRQEAFEKQGFTKKIIDGLWVEKTQYSNSKNILKDM